MLLVLAAACAGKTKTSDTTPIANSGGGSTTQYDFEGDEVSSGLPVPEAESPPPSGFKNGIRDTIRRDLAKLRYCYEKELLNDPNLQGTVNVDFTIMGDGSVSQVKASGLPPVDTCVETVFAAMRFAPPQAGGMITVHYPLVFQPSGP